MDFITYISYSARGGERRRPANELCGVMAMKYSWFHHHDCTTEQADTLISDYQKRGVRTEKTSTLLRKLNAGDYAGAADEFLRWNKAGGKVLNGLTRRREAERALFLS
ncbi:hypothetical protein BKC11_04965 [Salmonella enterica subsp. enterica serovar Typhimurium]|nr:hypothetical protein BKC11_04965 [Salmonella enterica subsp. enterica serovar Typhimurium]